MGKINLGQMFGAVKAVAIRRSPEILTGLGIAGMVTTTVLAVTATPKALKVLEAKKEEQQVDKLPVVETVKATWKFYIPATVTGVTSIACLVGASSVSARRNAALATAYSISQTALTEYKDKVVETIGEKKERDIRESIAKDKLEKDPVMNHDVVITKNKSLLCYDGTFGRYFYSDHDTIKRAIDTIRGDIITSGGYASLNEFYSLIGLDPIGVGDDLGWSLKHYKELDIMTDYGSAADGQPCMIIRYTVGPEYDYWRTT